MIDRLQNGVRALGAICLCAGLLFCYRAHRDIAQSAERLERSRALLMRLDELEFGMQDWLSARHTFDALDPARPSDPAVALKQTALKYRESRVADVPDAGSGWTVQRREIAFSDVRLETVMAFVDRVAAQRPPWRLVKVDIQASDHTAGMGQVVLMLEALEKSR
jgi:hypothetical protein